MSIWSDGMKLDNPTKFLKEGIDPTLIARGEIICQYSTVDDPKSNSDWSDTFSAENVYKWIRISLDYGKNFPFQYKLNNTDISIKFTINEDAFEDSGDSDYPKMYKYQIKNPALFEEIKHKPIGIFVTETVESAGKTISKSTSVLAPVVYRTETINNETKYYLDILVTNLFIQHNSGKTCFIKN
jgi:hypothetical protein